MLSAEIPRRFKVLEQAGMEGTSFTDWYGNWGAVAMTVLLGSGFALTFL